MKYARSMAASYLAHTLLILCLHFAHTIVTLAPGSPALAGGALRQYPLVL